MMRIIIEYMLRFKDITGKDLEEIIISNEVTIKELIELLSSKYGESFTEEFRNPSGDMISGKVLIIVNDRVVEDINMRLRDGDTVVLTYVASGG